MNNLFKPRHIEGTKYLVFNAAAIGAVAAAILFFLIKKILSTQIYANPLFWIGIVIVVSFFAIDSIAVRLLARVNIPYGDRIRAVELIVIYVMVIAIYLDLEQRTGTFGGFMYWFWLYRQLGHLLCTGLRYSGRWYVETVRGSDQNVAKRAPLPPTASSPGSALTTPLNSTSTTAAITPVHCPPHTPDPLCGTGAQPPSDPLKNPHPAHPEPWAMPVEGYERAFTHGPHRPTFPVHRSMQGGEASLPGVQEGVPLD